MKIPAGSTLMAGVSYILIPGHAGNGRTRIAVALAEKNLNQRFLSRFVVAY